MKTIGLRTLYKEAPNLTEDVLVLHGRRIIGTFRPVEVDYEARLVDGSTKVVTDDRMIYKEAPMDDIAKKAIEPDQVKRDPRGRLTKGLGPLPGEEIMDPEASFKQFRPVPKPGAKKS